MLPPSPLLLEYTNTQAHYDTVGFVENNQDESSDWEIKLRWRKKSKNVVKTYVQSEREKKTEKQRKFEYIKCFKKISELTEKNATWIHWYKWLGMGTTSVCGWGWGWFLVCVLASLKICTEIARNGQGHLADILHLYVRRKLIHRIPYSETETHISV